MKKVAEAISKLTQVQKTYLTRRIDQIAERKISEINSSATDSNYHQRYRVHGLTYIDEKVIRAILKNKIKLNTKKFLFETLKARLDGDRSHQYIHYEDFLNRDSLKAFNKARNEAARKGAEEHQARIDAVDSEAAVLKDKVILEGSLAANLLEDFEKKDF